MRVIYVISRLLVTVGAVTAVAAVEASPLTYARDIRPILEKYCWDCHGDGMDKGGLALDPYESEADLVKARKKWEGILFNIDNWLMPPVDKEQPTAEERKRLVQWIDDTVFPVDPDNPDPGRVTIRRLNKTEYNNTIRDLLGVDLRPADEFPDDDSGYGFDNIGDVLSMPPVLVERYLAAAETVVEAAVVAAPSTVGVTAEGLAVDERVGGRQGELVKLWSNGAATFRHQFPSDGQYRIRVRAHADQAGGDPARLAVQVDGEDLRTFDITATADQPQTIEFMARIKRGGRPVAAAFINDHVEDGRDRNLYIGHIEVAGPLWTDEFPLPESHRRVFVHDPETEGSEAATRTVLNTFASRAYRRPVRAEELNKLVGLVRRVQDGGASWPEAVKTALKATLVSPFFLYRIEWQPDPDDVRQVAELSDYALASRLSYFLWSSMPDDRLLSLAFRKELRPNLAAEIKRMLADPKARELARTFGGQWLETRNLEIVRPDRRKFGWDNDLRAAMRGETEEFFHFLLSENRSVLEFLSADYTFVNARLARHYGIDGVEGSEYQRVQLDPARRRGLLTHASVLTVTSDPTRTSPVKRGKWVLENLLGTPPPPPPPNVPTLESAREVHGTLRQRLEQHRANPACANCHAMLDPIGFGLENFDATGAWREEDEGQPIDSAGRLTSGQEFANASELTTILLRDKSDQFVRTLAAKLLTFGLGRGVEYYDKPALAQIVERTKAGNYGFHTMIIAIAESMPFQKRRGDGAGGE